MHRITSPLRVDKTLYVEPLWIQDIRAEHVAAAQFLEALDVLIEKVGRERTVVLIGQIMDAL